MKHLVSIHDLTDEAIRVLLDLADDMAMSRAKHNHHLDGRIICTAFFEPSTRTRLSFEAAAQRLGARVIGFSDPATTSSSKGETLEDTIRMLAGYSDLIVMRHPKEGAAKKAAKVATVPMVNAGDGPGEHPTQTLIDLYTMQKARGAIKGLKVALVGDLKFGRTVHSLLPALRRLGAQPIAVPAPGLELPDSLAKGIPVTDLETATREADVIYMTRVQKERFENPADYERVKLHFRMDAALLRHSKARMIVLHPLPRAGEIDESVDALPAAKYFEQAANGVPVRMAVLASLLEKTA